MTTKPLFAISWAASVALLSSAIHSPASILHSSDNFTLLGGTAVTSTGVAGTVIRNGNVGLSPGATSAITGFPPAVIQNGAIIATGATTRQARLDLIKARDALSRMPKDHILNNVDLGGKTLRPGVYSFNAAASLNGALVLDARGRNGAYWVFNIGTSLTTSTNSSVTVINRGSNNGRDCGIFWNAGSDITIGANNRISGNFLAGTSITFGDKSSANGRALALAGVSLASNQINATGGPGRSGWSAGLKYNDSGAVVPNPDLSFGYFGKRYRTTSNARSYIYGRATVTAAEVQWRVNGGAWRNVVVQYGGKWNLGVKADLLSYGSNEIELRARDSHGHRTALKTIQIRRLR